MSEVITKVAKAIYESQFVDEFVYRPNSIEYAMYIQNAKAALKALADEIDDKALNLAIYGTRGEGWESKRPMVEAAIKAYLSSLAEEV